MKREESKENNSAFHPPKIRTQSIPRYELFITGDSGGEMDEKTLCESVKTPTNLEVAGNIAAWQSIQMLTVIGMLLLVIWSLL